MIVREAPAQRKADQIQRRAHRTDRVLVAVARLGAATPEQVLAAAGAGDPSAVESSEVLRMYGRFRELARAGLLETDRIHTSQAVLRAYRRRLYRLTPDGERLAADIPRRQQRIVVALHGRGWQDEGWVWSRALPGFSSVYNVRTTLKAMHRSGVLEERLLPGPNGVLWATLSAGGWELVRDRGGPARTRPPRNDHVVHHLLVVHAALQLARSESAEVLAVTGDETLRARLQEGIRSRGGAAQHSIPDGEVLLRLPGGGCRTVGVEILTAKYTSADIKRKHADLPGVRFFASAASVADRAARFGLPRPTVLS